MFKEGEALWKILELSNCFKNENNGRLQNYHKNMKILAKDCRIGF